MSEQINIENSLYEFDIILMDDKGSKAIPVNKSSVKYLEVEDNLANIGIVGKITFSNFYGLLQKLNIYSVDTGSPNIFIRFKNLDFKEANASVEPQVYVHACLGKSTESSLNVVDRHLTFEFEESSIVKLKRSRYDRDSPGLNNPEKAIQAIFAVFCEEVSIKEEDIKATTNSTLPSNIIKANDTLFDIVLKCQDHMGYEPQAADGILSPPLITLENVEGEIERKLVIDSLANKISTFFSLIGEGSATDDDIPKVLNDKFTVALSDKSNVLRDNVITKYDVIRVDYEEVFEKKWSNLSKHYGDSDTSVTQWIGYPTLKAAFEQLFTAPYISNLPQRDEDSIKILKYHYPGVTPATTTTCWATNRILNSFVFDNTTVIFKVKGQPYRIPGRFIRINVDDPTRANNVSDSTSSTSSDSDENADSLNGWWYVISVKHVFENDIYFNVITAVKFYLPQKSQTSVTYNSNNTGSGSDISSTGSNSTDYNSTDYNSTYNSSNGLLPSSDLSIYDQTLEQYQKLIAKPSYIKTKQSSQTFNQDFEQAFDNYNIPSQGEADNVISNSFNDLEKLLPPL